MKVIIFGATGGIGKYAVKYAKELGYDVSVYVRNTSRFTEEDVCVMKGEISDYENMKNAIMGQDAIIWCVGIPLKRKYDKMESLEG